MRATGGLADTVRDVDDAAVPAGQGNGFSFSGVDETSLNGALDRAIGYYRDKPEWWAELRDGNMARDYSWGPSAGQYVSLYESVAVPN